MTADDFVAWAMEQPEGARYELVAGEVVSMASERSLHALTKQRVARRLDEAIERRGLQCYVYPDDMAVRIDAETVYEPDGMVRCGAAVPDDAAVLTDPVIVVEVRSPSTGSRDASEKMADYLRIPSLRHCLIVIAHTRTIIHHERGADGRIATAIVRDGPVTLDPPGITLDGVWPPPVQEPGSTPP